MKPKSTVGRSVYESLCNSIDNGYEHDYSRNPTDVYEEIDYYSGIEGFDADKYEDRLEAMLAVNRWREDHKNRTDHPCAWYNESAQHKE